MKLPTINAALLLVLSPDLSSGCHTRFITLIGKSWLAFHNCTWLCFKMAVHSIRRSFSINLAQPAFMNLFLTPMSLLNLLPVSLSVAFHQLLCERLFRVLPRFFFQMSNRLDCHLRLARTPPPQNVLPKLLAPPDADEH